MKKIFILIFMVFFTACNNIEDKSIKKENEYKVRLIAVGDNLIHQSVYEAAKVNDSYDFKPMFSEIKPYINSFDLAFINQETILGGKELGLSSYPCFNSPHELGDALVDAGFNLISIANNHTLDRGEKAVLNSIDYWDTQEVIYAGANKSNDDEKVKLFEKNNINFAYLAYTYGTNGIPHPNGKTHLAHIYSNEAAKKDLESLSNDIDITIVSMHWGEEYQDYPTIVQKQQAADLAALGVDIIIGHHPHVIQPIDIIANVQGKQTTIFYSLGNFLSDQRGTDRLIGMAASLEILKKDDGKTILTTISEPKVKLLYRYKKNNIFTIKMFENLDENFLLNYQLYFDEKKNLITTYQEIDVS